MRSVVCPPEAKSRPVLCIRIRHASHSPRLYRPNLRDKLNIRNGKLWEIVMTVARVTEISASSKKSFEDAVSVGIERASKTLRKVEGAWIKEQKVVVKKGAISEYRVNMQVTFLLDD